MARVARLASALVLAATGASAVVTQDCALPGAGCVLADVARQAHFFVGAIANQFQTDADRALLARHFDATVAENEMKWGVIAPTVGNYDFTQADAIADFAAANGLRLVGNVLVWGRLQLPTDLATQVAAAADPAARLRALMAAHFQTMIGRYGDRVAQWEVVDEPLNVASGAYDDDIFYDTLGPGYIADAFRMARALAPSAELMLNEFSLVLPSDKADALVALVRSLRADGVPLDVVGFQGHVFPSLPLPDPAQVQALLQSLGDLGVKVEITELDVSIWQFRNDPDPFARQGEYYGKIAAACIAVPQCRGITTWGLIDSESWLDTFPPFDGYKPNEPVLFDGNRQPKPAYFAVRDAIAARAVPFATQASALLSAWVDAANARTLVGPPPRRRGVHALRRGRKALVRTARLLGRGRFARACERLAVAGDVLASATGVAAPDLARTLATLRADLRCDDPPAS